MSERIDVSWCAENPELAAADLNRLYDEVGLLKEWIKLNADHGSECMGFMAKIEDDGSETDLPCTCGLRDLIPDFEQTNVHDTVRDPSRCIYCGVKDGCECDGPFSESPEYARMKRRDG